MYPVDQRKSGIIIKKGIKKGGGLFFNDIYVGYLAEIKYSVTHKKLE